jgi:hypothetical protein
MTQTDELFTQTHQRDDGVWVIGRREFASQYFHYKPGEHVLFGGPTQRGKTTLAFDLLEFCAFPQCPAYVAVSKPHDKVTAKRGIELGYRRVSDWPVPKKLGEIWNGPPSGYLIWPQFGDLDSDIDNCSRITASLLNDRYTAGVRNKKGILVMDDTMVKSKVLGLDQKMVTISAMSGAMGIGQWTFVQKATDSGRAAIWSYSQAEHIFLLPDPSKTAQKNYAMISGADPESFIAVSKTLQPFQFLYYKRTEKYLCVVDKG